MKRLVPILQFIGRWIQRQPLRFLWLLVLWMAVVLPWLQRDEKKPGEFYPFSNLPMYSSFAPSTYYVYVTDLAGEPIAVQYLSGRVLSNVKKIYDTELKRLKDASGGKIKVADLPIEMRQQAGAIVLEWLVANSPAENLAKHSGLKLRQVDILYGERGIEKIEREVGELALR